jgi:hypothetical protein
VFGLPSPSTTWRIRGFALKAPKPRSVFVHADLVGSGPLRHSASHRVEPDLGRVSSAAAVAGARFTDGRFYQRVIFSGTEVREDQLLI